MDFSFTAAVVDSARRAAPDRITLASRMPPPNRVVF
jgi:hypothetical protein